MVRRLKSAGFGYGLVVLSVSYSALGDPIADAEKKLMENYTKVQSCSAKVKTVQDIDLSEGNRVKSDAEGTVEWMRKGDKMLYRSDLKTSATQNFGGQEMKTDATALMVSDGDFYYLFSEQAGQKMAIKQKPDPSLGGDPKTTLDQIRADQTLKLLPDEKIDGQDCYVFEAVPKDLANNPILKTLIYFRKDVGLAVKTIGRDKSDKPVFTSTTSDVKLNADIKADRFVFKAPPGVEVQDMTKSP